MTAMVTAIVAVPHLYVLSLIIKLPVFWVSTDCSVVSVRGVFGDEAFFAG